MKANSKKGMAKKGSLRKTITKVITDKDEKQTIVIKVVFNPKRYTSSFDNKLNTYFPISKYGSREKQIEAYHHARFVNKKQDIIRAFGNC